MTDRMPGYVSASNLWKRFPGEGIDALRGISFSVASGGQVAIMGPSGCGKSTLLSLLGLLDRPSSGEVCIGGTDIHRLSQPHRFRAATIGFVFQDHHLLPAMSLVENVETPLVPLGIPKRVRRERARALLDKMGLEGRVDSFPSRVSGGERQRAAIARALIANPALILADEPTGNLDTATGRIVFELLLSGARHSGATGLLSTHNHELASRVDRILWMRDGMLVPEPIVANHGPVEPCRENHFFRPERISASRAG